TTKMTPTKVNLKGDANLLGNEAPLSPRNNQPQNLKQVAKNQKRWFSMKILPTPLFLWPRP
ncbi:MAG: hypothetical protein EBX52_13645, partial [Proteobacteria bacterium]|nr:hypothetical protein [Pseudomonadota bacterium]